MLHQFKRSLYEILEPHHGLLQKGIKIIAPQSINYNNYIHEYTAQFHSYLTSQELEGLHYTEEKKITTYLLSLDQHFSPAITHVEDLLDSWGQPGLNLKCDLWWLPTTIDKFMTRYTSVRATYPTMHTLQYRPNFLDSHIDTNNDIILRLAKPKLVETPDSRKSMDMFCDACGQHGNPWKCCNYLAKLIKALDFTSKLDKPKQLELLATFHKEQQKQREH
jgi:hypothetical protein